MRRHRGIDKNQPEIVSALIAAGATVLDLSGVGEGCPDLLVGFTRPECGTRLNLLVEVKDATCKRWKGNLRGPQVEFFDTWLGQVAKVTTPQEALALLNPTD